MILSRQTPGELVVKSVIVVSLTLLTIITLYPFWYILVASFSDPYAVVRRGGLMMKIIVFTMFFTGGMIPTYLVVDGLGMIDTVWSQIIPHAINTFNLVVLRRAFKAVPNSIEEAASID